MVELDQYRYKISDYDKPLQQIKNSLDLDNKQKRIEELEADMEAPGFWDDTEKSQKAMKELKALKDSFEKYDALVRGLEDTKTLIEMAEEENDASLLPEIDSEITTFEEHLEELRIETLLSGEYDRSNAILTLHAGAGGTESCDWCQMLMRMYTRWAERKGYTTEVIDYLEGEEAGVKSVTIEISGPDAYGHLKSEHGVHRLVRISPFNAAGKRQTSFVSCDVMPDIDENIDIEINPDDLRIAYETGITKVILPEFDICMTTNQNHPHHCYTVGEHILHSMCEIRPDKVLRLAMLFHDIGKPDAITTDEHGINHFHGHPEISAAYAQKIMRRLKFDNKSIYYVTNLVRYHDVRMELSRKSVRRAINKIGDDIFPLLFEVREADTLAQSMYKRKEKEQNLAKLKEIYEDIVASRECVSLKQLAVTGSDLIREAGIPEGPQVGVKLKELLSLVIEDPSRNTKEYLLSAAKQ